MFIRTPKDLGALVRAARKARGWSQADLAARMGTTQKWVSFVENGRPGSPLDMVLRTLATLKVSVDARLPDDRVKPWSLIDQVADGGKHGR